LAGLRGGAAVVLIDMTPTFYTKPRV